MESNFTLKEMERMDSGLAPWESMSFACGGWLQFYMFGVGKALQESGMDKGVAYYGCSAGALTAAGLALEGDFDAGVKYAKEECITVAYKSLAGLVQLEVYVGGSTQNCLVPFYSKEKASRLTVVTTSLPFFRPVRLRDFDSAEDMKSAILASCAAFPAAKSHVHRGVRYVDGGVTDFQPVLDDNTVTVSPFYFSNADIKPSRYVPLWWAFLPPNSPHTVDWLYSLGYEDTLKYLETRKVLDYVNRKDKQQQQQQQQLKESKEQDTANPSDKTAAAATVAPLVKKVSVSTWEQLKTFVNRHREFWSPAHPYDKPSKVSLHRFLGYDMHTFTNYYIAFLLDLYLLFLLLFVWKPLALCLIYVELLCRIVYLNVVILLKVTGLYFVLQRLLPMSASSFNSTVDELNDCVWCVLSLSLALRFISGRPTPSVELRKHDRLAKHSLLYRVFRHII